MKNIVLAVLLTTGTVVADTKVNDLQSDWLEAEQGSSGQTLGAEVKQVKSLGSDGVRIDLTITLEDAGRYDGIEVISRETSLPMKQSRPHLWIEDYEKGNYGLRLYLKKHPKVGFRVRLQDSSRD